MYSLCYHIIQTTWKLRDLKATVPRFEPREEPKVKTVLRTVFRESADRRYVRR